MCWSKVCEGEKVTGLDPVGPSRSLKDVKWEVKLLWDFKQRSVMICFNRNSLAFVLRINHKGVGVDAGRLVWRLLEVSRPEMTVAQTKMVVVEILRSGLVLLI